MRPSDDFVIPAFSGSPLNHYRVRDGQVEFRSVHGNSSGLWRRLSIEDVLMHLVLKTAVAEWLYARRKFIAETMSEVAA